jgi:hypothetical protein
MEARVTRVLGTVLGASRGTRCTCNLCTILWKIKSLLYSGNSTGDGRGGVVRSRRGPSGVCRCCMRWNGSRCVAGQGVVRGWDMPNKGIQLSSCAGENYPGLLLLLLLNRESPRDLPVHDPGWHRTGHFPRMAGMSNPTRVPMTEYHRSE